MVASHFRFCYFLCFLWLKTSSFSSVPSTSVGASLSISSQSSFWCIQIGSAFLRMSSPISMPSTVGGRLTRFCFPLMNIVMYSCWRFFFSAFSAEVNFRFVMTLPLFVLRQRRVRLTRHRAASNRLVGPYSVSLPYLIHQYNCLRLYQLCYWLNDFC